MLARAFIDVKAAANARLAQRSLEDARAGMSLDNTTLNTSPICGREPPKPLGMASPSSSTTRCMAVEAAAAGKR